ncbi:quinol:cytochrome c oxidoreductase membrane protein 1 [Candidatus Sulfopaludibacter sp. SbA6]|nr:quinol:cytochrome c oxidoreductase membrane protein 1 [Candidatus Sulfopaludibacter sp. SbA6]
MYLIGEFREKDAVRAAIRMLRETGVRPSELDLFSEEPVEFPRGVLDRPSRMSLVSVLGAMAFGSLATAFIYWTQHNYRLVTGGMPLFSFWATGVITFEMTMLGAIVATFALFLWESGLVRKRDYSAPVPEVDPGAICLRVRCRAEDAPQAIAAIRRAGGHQR